MLLQNDYYNRNIDYKAHVGIIMSITISYDANPVRFSRNSIATNR